MGEKRIVLSHGNKEDISKLKVGEVGLCTNTSERFIGTEEGAVMINESHCRECRDEIEGEIYIGNRCTDCYIAFLEHELELWIKRKTSDNSKAELLKENEKLKEQIKAKDRNISRLNLEAQRWFDIAMDELHK